MKLRILLASLAVFAASSATPAIAAPGGKLGTMAGGRWICEIPGDATMRPTRQEADDFSIVPDSSYRTPDGRSGTYLLLGDRLTMTSGPFDGKRFVLDSAAMIHPLDQNDQPEALRCVKSGSPSVFVDPAPFIPPASDQIAAPAN